MNLDIERAKTENIVDYTKPFGKLRTLVRGGPYGSDIMRGGGESSRLFYTR